MTETGVGYVIAYFVLYIETGIRDSMFGVLDRDRDTWQYVLCYR